MLTRMPSLDGTTANVTGTFNAPAAGSEGTKLTLSLAPVTDPGSADVLQYSFDCGDGKGFSNPSSLNSRACTPSDNGTINVRGRVQDDDGMGTIYSAAIAVANLAPTATLVQPKPVNEGSPFTLALTKPMDAPADQASLQYALTCPGAPDGAFGSATSVSCPTTDNGAYQIRGIVRDKDGASTIYQGAVTVLNVAPTVVIDGFNEPSNSRTRTVMLHFTDPNPNDGFPNQANRWLVRVDWGDGTGAQGFFQQLPQLVFGHDYTAAGNWSIQITVTDKDNGSGVTIVKTKTK